MAWFLPIEEKSIMTKLMLPKRQTSLRSCRMDSRTVCSSFQVLATDIGKDFLFTQFRLKVFPLEKVTIHFTIGVVLQINGNTVSRREKLCNPEMLLIDVNREQNGDNQQRKHHQRCDDSLLETKHTNNGNLCNDHARRYD